MKKLLALVLALLMVLGCMSVTAFAAEILTEVNFILSEYVDENTAMTITVSTEETANFSKTKFDGFLCVDGNSTYIRSYKEGNGFTQAGFDDWENYIEETVETPELDRSTMFAMFNLTTENKEVIDHEATVIKNGGTVVPNISAYVAAGDQTEMLNFMTAPTDSFWNYNETELTVFIKLFGPAPTSGSTTITANVAKPDVEYEIVIPQAVTMDKAGVKAIGAAKISTEDGDLKYATDNTVISYTASGTNFTLTGGEATMTATYYTDSEGKTALTDNAIVVYKDSALVEPLTTLYVGVTQEVWDTAAMSNPGTYTATVTYNFSAEEVEAGVTIGDVLATVDGGFPENFNAAWGYDDESYYCCFCFKDSDVDKLGFYDDPESDPLVSFELSETLTTVDGGYKFAAGTNVLTFEMTSDELTSIVAAFDGGSGQGSGTYVYMGSA